MEPSAYGPENEYRVYGSPGCGKSTELARQTRRAVEARGSDSVLLLSFTRTAAARLAGENLPISRQQIGTLHAHAYRALGQPRVAADVLDEWNTSNPDLHLSGDGKGSPLDDGYGEGIFATDADGLSAAAQIYRAQMLPIDQWPREDVVMFQQRWESWKRDCDVVDFTDMIEIALRDTTAAPGDPSVIMVDETQDMAMLELALVRHWGKQADLYVLAGDDSQAIFSFKGADPYAFLDPPLPPAQKKVLPQSYRVPRVVQRLAETWIKQVARREEKEYRPRPEEGFAQHLPGVTWRDPWGVLPVIEKHALEGQTTLILTTCGYMLEPVKAVLKNQGIPFHNPYRRLRGDWNPLHPGKGLSTAQRLLAFLRPDTATWGTEARMWDRQDLRIWVELLKGDGILKRGAKAQIKDDVKEGAYSIDELLALFEEDALNAAMDMDVTWLQDHALASKINALTYPIRIATTRGAQALQAEPVVLIGSIHSLKGGEADNVILFPDVSMAGYEGWDTNGEAHDSIVRQFYVGLTRARHGLYIADPSSGLQIPVRDLLTME